MARLPTVRAYLSARSDGAALSVVVITAALLRLAFLFRAPPLYAGGDSHSYLLPAVDLLQGFDFNPEIKRPPGYPLFLAGVMAAMGSDLQGVVFVQHLLGVVTAATTWAIGRVVYGPLAGLLAGLMIAVNGPLLIFEQYIMAETLTTCLLALAVLATVSAARRHMKHPGAAVSTTPRGFTALLLLAGLLFGLASAAHQRTQMLAGLAPLALLLSGAGWRELLRGTGAVLIGFLLVLLPWMAFDYSRHQVVSSGALGETLISRLTRHGPDEYFKARPNRVEDERLNRARRFAYEAAADRMLPGDIREGIERHYGLTTAQADSVLRSLALEAIVQRPDRYLATSFEYLLENLLGTEQWLGGAGKEGGRIHYVEVERKYQGWWSEQTRPLIQGANAAQEREFQRAQFLGDLFQPYRFGWPLLGLFLVGVAAAVVLRERRLGLVPALGALAILTLAAFVSGVRARFRYPAEPLLAVVEMGGLVTLIGLVRSVPQLLARVRPPASLRRRSLAGQGARGEI
jgi:hypothetical protein